MSYTKKDLVNELHTMQPLVSKVDIERMLDNLGTVVREVILDEGRIDLLGIGRFSRVGRAARIARNPQTGEAVQIPAKMVVKFKPAKVLRDAVNTGNGAH